ncbi:MAG: hypothetical protein QGI18_05870 [Candidatus Marinimicrobia bacterium]|jgi:uncharacterized membrane protein|nr:hypothetical protein [Candidatus Neomarinimicrobiota bacterium]
MIRIVRAVSAFIFGIFLINVGVLHFTDTSWFEPIVPKIPGSATFWVIVSGIAEIILGIGLIFPKSREIAAKCTAIFLVMIYSANLYMWIYNIKLGDGTYLSTSGHVLRLFAQILMIGLNLWISRIKSWAELMPYWLK